MNYPKLKQGVFLPVHLINRNQKVPQGQLYMNTIWGYLKSKTVQGILGLVFLGILKTQHIALLDDETMGLLGVLFLGWVGIGIRGAMPKAINPPGDTKPNQ